MKKTLIKRMGSGKCYTTLGNLWVGIYWNTDLSMDEVDNLLLSNHFIESQGKVYLLE